MKKKYSTIDVSSFSAVLKERVEEIELETLSIFFFMNLIDTINI